MMHLTKGDLRRIVEALEQLEKAGLDVPAVRVGQAVVLVTREGGGQRDGGYWYVVTDIEAAPEPKHPRGGS